MTLAVAPIPAQTNMIQAGWPFYWFNPETQVVGTPLNVGRVLVPKGPGEDWDEALPRTETAYPQRPWRKSSFLLTDLAPLSKCTIDPVTGHFESPIDLRIDRQAKEGQREIAALKQQAKERYDQRVAKELAAADTARRVAAERAEAERVAAERAEAERVAVERAEAERVAAERLADELRTAEQEARPRDQALPVARDIPSPLAVPGVRPQQSHERFVPAAKKPARGWFQRWLGIFSRR